MTTQPTSHGALISRQFRLVVAGLEIVAVILVAYFLVQLVYALITPITIPSPLVFASTNNGIRANETGSLDAVVSFDPFFRRSNAPVEHDTTAPESNLRLVISGTRASSDNSGKGTAIVNAQDGKQKLIKVGDEISRGVELVAVYVDRVEISRGGLRETIYTQKPERDGQQSTRVEGQPSRSDKPDNVAMANNSWVQQMLTKIPFEPARNNGRLIGFRVGETSENTLLNGLGLEVGDVILAVGGSPLTSFERLGELESEIQPGKAIVIDIERRGETLSITVGG